MSMEYQPPEFRDFGKDCKNIRSGMSPQQEEEARTGGKFVLSALENSIKLWALNGNLSHLGLIDKYSVEGKILGGGSIRFIEDKRWVQVFGHSGSFGGLPNKVLKDYFEHFGYESQVEMNESYTQAGTRNWFKERGISG